MSLYGCIKDHVYSTTPHTAQELKAEIEAIAEEVRGETLRDTVGNLFASSRCRRMSY